MDEVLLREHQKINYPRSGVGIPGSPADMDGLEAHPTSKNGILEKLEVPKTHYSLLITHYSLLITHYSLLITHYSLLITHYSSFRRA